MHNAQKKTHFHKFYFLFVYLMKPFTKVFSHHLFIHGPLRPKFFIYAFETIWPLVDNALVHYQQLLFNCPAFVFQTTFEYYISYHFKLKFLHRQYTHCNWSFMIYLPIPTSKTTNFQYLTSFMISYLTGLCDRHSTFILF